MDQRETAGQPKGDGKLMDPTNPAGVSGGN